MLKPAAFIEQFLKRNHALVRSDFAKVFDVLLERTKTKSKSEKKQKKAAKKAKVVMENFEELNKVKLKENFNKKDYLVTAYLQYLLYAYHLSEK